VFVTPDVIIRRVGRICKVVKRTRYRPAIRITCSDITTNSLSLPFRFRWARDCKIVYYPRAHIEPLRMGSSQLKFSTYVTASSLLQCGVSRLESLSHRNFSNIRLSEETMLSSNFFASNRRCLFFSDQFSYRSIVPRSLSRLELDDDDFTIATFPSKTRRVSSKLLAKGLSPSLLSGRNCARAYTYLRSPMARARFQKHVHAAPQEFRPQLHFARPCKRMLAFAKLLLNRPPVPALAVCLALSNLRPSPRARVKNNYSRVSLVEEWCECNFENSVKTRRRYSFASHWALYLKVGPGTLLSQIKWIVSF